MNADPGSVLVDASIAGPLGPGQVVTAVTDASGLVRAAVAFGLVVFVGGSLLWRAAPFVDRSRAASLDHPLSALGYGLATHAVVAFGAVYLANKLARYGVFGSHSGTVGVGAGLTVVAVAGAVGFTIVGSTVTDLLEGGDRRLGVVVGALAAASAATVAASAAAVVWFVVVSFGIGGAVREWYHASAIDEIREEHA